MKYKPLSIIFTEQFVTSLLSHMCAKTNNQGLLNWHKYNDTFPKVVEMWNPDFSHSAYKPDTWYDLS